MLQPCRCGFGKHAGEGGRGFPKHPRCKKALVYVSPPIGSTQRRRPRSRTGVLFLVWDRGGGVDGSSRAPPHPGSPRRWDIFFGTKIFCKGAMLSIFRIFLTNLSYRQHTSRRNTNCPASLTSSIMFRTMHSHFLQMLHNKLQFSKSLCFGVLLICCVFDCGGG